MNFLIDQQEQLNELEATINELRSRIFTGKNL